MLFRMGAVLLALSLLPNSQAFTIPTSFLPKSGAAGVLEIGVTVVEQSSYQGKWRLSSTNLRVSRSTSSKPTEATASDDDEAEAAKTGATLASAKVASGEPPVSLTMTDPVSKFRKLKDLMWIREAVEDVTAAEFACSVEGSSEGEKDASLRRKRKRAVDYEKMLSNLDRRVRDMIPELKDIEEEEAWKLNEKRGMGRFAYTDEERDDFLR